MARALFSVPAHYFFAILMGYYYSLYHFGIDRSVKAKVMVLVAPILAHGIFDALLFCMRVDESLCGILMLLHKIEEESKAADRGFVKTNCFGGIENI